jgi:2-C-methyl-D-erythritol 4-phosphate cytidylyltransferase
MKSAIPKQFLLLQGRPLLLLTLERFAAAMPDAIFIIVLPEDQMAYWKELTLKYNCNIQHLTVPGGSTRFESVKNGLKHTNGGLTAIHDGVRPFPSVQLIKRCFSEAAQFGSAIPVTPLTDTIRMIDSSGITNVVDRTLLRSTQTPQCFGTEMIKAAYEKAGNFSFTDCASVLEHQGEIVHLTEGEVSNIKITVPADLDYAAWIFTKQNM